MNLNFQEILNRIAAENQTTPEDVYHEMQVAIDAAFNDPDPRIRKNWEHIHYTGERPTPEDVVYGIGLMLQPKDHKNHFYM